MIIYALLDPRTDAVRYVGATRKTLVEKIRMHVSSAQLAQNVAPRFVWLRELMALNLKPKIIKLDECDESKWAITEDSWIEYFRAQGCDMLNVNHGGGGPRSTSVRRRWTDEEKARQSLKTSNLMQSDPDLRARVAAGVRRHAAARTATEDSERRRKIGDAVRKRYEDPAERTRVSDRTRVHWSKPGTRAALSAKVSQAAAREQRVKCPGCDMISRAGNIARHQKAKGH